MQWSRMTRIRSIIRSSWVVCILSLARFLLGSNFRSYHRRCDRAFAEAIIVHKCSVRAMLVSSNPYSVGDSVTYKVVAYPSGSVPQSVTYFEIKEIDGDMLSGIGAAGGTCLMHWRTLLLNELLCKTGFNDLNLLETIF